MEPTVLDATVQKVDVEQVLLRESTLQASANRDSDCLDEYAWIPPGLGQAQVHEYMRSLPESKTPYVGRAGSVYRSGQLLQQLPPQDNEVRFCRGLSDEEKREHRLFNESRKKEALGRGTVRALDGGCEARCKQCQDAIPQDSLVVMASRAGDDVFWHPACFVCCRCKELLVDLVYFYKSGLLYCGRHHADSLKPRCGGCDEIIFSDECTEAEGRSWHIPHFACTDCDAQLGGSRYVMRGGRPYCTSCYETRHADRCQTCRHVIGVDDGYMSHGRLQWHATEECFQCSGCTQSLMGCAFLCKDDAFYCNECCGMAAGAGNDSRASKRSSVYDNYQIRQDGECREGLTVEGGPVEWVEFRCADDGSMNPIGRQASIATCMEKGFGPGGASPGEKPCEIRSSSSGNTSATMMMDHVNDPRKSPALLLHESDLVLKRSDSSRLRRPDSASHLQPGLRALSEPRDAVDLPVGKGECYKSADCYPDRVPECDTNGYVKRRALLMDGIQPVGGAFGEANLPSISRSLSTSSSFEYKRRDYSPRGKELWIKSPGRQSSLGSLRKTLVANSGTVLGKLSRPACHGVADFQYAGGCEIYGPLRKDNSSDVYEDLRADYDDQDDDTYGRLLGASDGNRVFGRAEKVNAEHEMHRSGSGTALHANAEKCVSNENHSDDNQVYAVITQDLGELGLHGESCSPQTVAQCEGKVRKNKQQRSVRFDPSTKDKVSPAPGEERYSRRHRRLRRASRHDSSHYASEDESRSRRHRDWCEPGVGPWSRRDYVAAGWDQPRNRMSAGGLRYTRSTLGPHGRPPGDEFERDELDRWSTMRGDEDEDERCSTCSSSSSDSDDGYRSLAYVDLDVGRGRKVRPVSDSVPVRGYWSSTLPTRYEHQTGVRRTEQAPKVKHSASAVDSSAKPKKKWYRKKHCSVS